jgi:hypothetical protein
MPIRASNIILIYVVLAVVMFGGGIITWDDTGPTQFFVDMGPDGVTPSDETQDNLQGVSGAITSLVGSFGGPAVLVWNLFAGLVSFIHWPLFVSLEAGAPLRVVLLLGLIPTVMFYMAVIRLVRASA